MKEYKLYKRDKLVEDLYDDKDLQLLLQNKFKFTRKYDMERCEETVSFEDIDWNFVPFGDDEWKWVFHRMDYCYDLCIETIKTNDDKYIIKAKQLILDFIKKNNANHKQAGLRTLDTGIRLIVWVNCLEQFERFDVITNDEYDLICVSIKWQSELLHDNFSLFQSFSNWGLMQCVGLLNAATIVDIDEQILEFYEQKFLSHLTTQYFDDGMQWEQSSVYTIEVSTRLASLVNAKYHTKQYYELLIKAANVIYGLGNVDNKTILLGDGDRIDTIGFVQHIAYLTKDEKLLQIASKHKLREEVYFEFGDSALTYFASIENSNKIVREDFNFSASGLYSIKDDQKYLSFQNGNLGGGHGHFDNLHVNFSLNNKKVLVDSGRHSYVEGEETRKYYKEVSAHNGFELDENIYEYAGAWGTRGKYMYTPIVKKIKNDITYMESSIHKDGVNCMRKLIYLPSGELVIIDTSNANYKLNFITDYENSICQTEENKYLIDDVKLTIINGTSKIEDCYVSPYYNTRKSSKKVTVENNEDVTISVFTNRDTTVEIDNKVKYFYGESQNKDTNTLQSICLKTAQSEYVIAHIPYEYGSNRGVLQYDGEQILYGSVLVYEINTKHITSFKG